MNLNKSDCLLLVATEETTSGLLIGNSFNLTPQQGNRIHSEAVTSSGWGFHFY